MGYTDKEYEKKYKHQWYLNNKQRHMDAKKERRKKFVEWLNNYKKTLICIDCGMSFKDHPECCDFHHLGEKADNVAHIQTEKAFLREIKKCVPICANCHRIEHKRISGCGSTVE